MIIQSLIKRFMAAYKINEKSGLEIRGCREPRAPLKSPATPSKFCREPKYVLFDIQKTSMKLM